MNDGLRGAGLAIDHVIAVVTDLEAAAEHLLEEHGLASVPGGRHPGHGTGNRIVPLGSDYLELMAAFDEAEARSSPLGQWALERRRPDVIPAALCIRTDDIGPIARALGEEPIGMARRTPDDRQLRWQLAGLGGMLEGGHPFFIEWQCAPDEHPASTAAAHHVRPVGITSVTVDAVPEALADVIGDIRGVDVSDTRRLVIGTTTGPITLE